METRLIPMEIRSVDESRREVIGVCVPYGMTTRAVADPRGERIMPGAFAKSISERGNRVLLFREHGHRRGEGAIGKAVAFDDSATELRGVFQVRDGEAGDAALADFRDGYLPSLSIGFESKRERRGADGAVEVVEARLVEVSGTAIPAYEGADVLAVRHAQPVDVAAMFGKMPEVNLSPIPVTWAYPHH